ncbi:MAG: cohesin domain-containing protein, partial [Dehalococcoidia bacterium]
NLKPYLTSTVLDFTGLEQALPALLQFLDEFPNSTYQPYVLEGLDPVASEFSDQLLIPPTVQLIASPTTGNPPLRVTLTAATQKQRGTVEEYLWDLDGDGQVDETTTEPTINHTFTEAGSFPTSVLVIDNSNLAASDTVLIATQPGFHLGFLPQGLALLPGETGDIRVDVTPMNRGISAAEVEITFDPQIIQVTEIQPGDLLGENPIVGLSAIDNSAGVVRLALARLGPSVAPASGGTLARLSLEATETAPSQSGTLLELSSVQLVNEALELAAPSEIVNLGPGGVFIP